MSARYCDECEAELAADEVTWAGHPALVTDGDHYWCRPCWDDRAERIREQREATEQEDAPAPDGADICECPRCGGLMPTGDDAVCMSAKCAAFRAWAAEQPDVGEGAQP